MAFQSVSTSVDGVMNPSTSNAGLEAGLHKAAKALFQTTEPLKGKMYTATKSRCNTNTGTSMHILHGTEHSFFHTALLFNLRSIIRLNNISNFSSFLRVKKLQLCYTEQPINDMHRHKSCLVTALRKRHIPYVEIKCQLDARDDFYCRSYCLLNMFRAPLCPSSGAREYYTGGCYLWYLVLWFSSCRYGVELGVMCPVCELLQPDT
jgi:hypothetical protein